MAEKTAVILFNLGGPDSKEAIKPFLYNFFMDPAIIGAPKPVRWLLAKYISVKRSRKEAGESYGALGDKSPLLENTQKQAEELEKELNKGSHEFKTFIAMRYWHPMTESAIKQVKEYNPDDIVLLPLYPQFSTTTTGSSFGAWEKACLQHDVNQPQAKICCYPMEKGFVEASAKNILKAYDQGLKQASKLDSAPPRILFSAHGLPESIIKSGDPYQWQCEQTAEAIIRKIDRPALDWKICYQSRVGPKKWIGPSTEEEIERAAKEKVPLIIYPHAFVSEHVETLVELDIEYKELAEKLGIPFYIRVPTVSEDGLFIKGLATIVKSAAGKQGLFSGFSDQICPAGYNRCCMYENKTQRKAA
jgi:ferrochelatase